MRGRWCTMLLVLGGLRLAGTVGGKQRAPPEEQPLGCSDGEVEDDDTLDEHDRCYWDWAEQDRIDEQECASRLFGASSSAELPSTALVVASASSVGRPAEIGNEVDVAELKRLAAQPGLSNQDMADALGVHVRIIKYHKAKHSLTHLHPTPALPPVEVLQDQWSEYPQTRVADLAAHLGVSATTLRLHFREVGFRPRDHGISDATIIKALQTIRDSGVCCHLGVTFAEARLRVEFGLVGLRPAQILRCLKSADPKGHEKRKAAAMKTKYTYDVAGPRSLYHMDAHEKLAKIWGFWFHLLIDGYSRFIIYLTVAPDKAAETVRRLFVLACNQVGWSSRLRSDRGKENQGAIVEQINHWWDDDRGQEWNVARGSALTGRSTQNCRAEYVWAHLVVHVVNYFREKFFHMQRELQILDPSLATDLFCLHAVYLDLIQIAADTFREMWNNRRIRGKRTVRGRGGGIPAELFVDPVGSDSVRDADDERFHANPSLYGVDDEFKGDTPELDIDCVRLVDPLHEFAFAQQVRAAYFERWPMDRSSLDGIADYRRFKRVSFALLALYALPATDRGIDMEGWVGSSDVEESEREAERVLRFELAQIMNELP